MSRRNASTGVAERGALPMLSRANLLVLAYGAATAGAIGTVGFSALSLGLPTGLFFALLADGIARPGSSVFYPTVTHGPRDGERVALSFDDGPDPEVTPAVLDALAKHGAHATFFTIGQLLVAHPQLARRIVVEGHELGNHSWRHSRWQNFFGAGEQAREIERGAQAIAGVTGSQVKPLYRPPIGLKSPPLARAAYQQQLTLVAWSLHSRDTRTADPKRIAQRVLQRIRPGDIVLMHDGHDLPGRHRPACAQATPLILQGLSEKGLQCVSVSELLQLAR
ncbi:MAG: putative xylanase/chitin deacetylase [Deltaproteobacteria bacterium]|nr:putative xylanase/chitin deacetylase [Deltaproteobacteria bacterium]